MSDKIKQVATIFGIWKCNRCKKDLTRNSAETCWYCEAPLCFDCWESYGHCGHPEADKLNAIAAATYGKKPKT